MSERILCFKMPKKSTVSTTVLSDGQIEICGNTFPLREQIKAAAIAAGGKAVWNAVRKVWIVPTGTVVDFETPTPASTPTSTSTTTPREEWTRHQWCVWISDFKRRNGGRVTPCCSHAKWSGDPYGPICYSCVRHGETKGDYTGD